MFRIGVDFDNTIACYDPLFRDVALAMGLVAPVVGASKAAVKAQILSQSDGDLNWQRLQGQLYGKYMLKAEMFPGFCEFLYLSKLRGHKVFIVSHKSQFGHFDEDQISLCDQALRWLQLNKFFEQDGLALDKQDVFFEPTREDKIRRICDLNCTHFIDDLSEVFEEPLFPDDVQKILFSPNNTEHPKPLIHLSLLPSWREVTHRLYGFWTEADVCQVVQARFPLLGIKQVELKKGRGNSRIYKLLGSENNYALKIYPDRQRDPRPRLETEFSACQMLQAHGYPVTEAVTSDNILGWAIYRWIDGAPIEKPNTLFLDEAIKFVRRLTSDSQRLNSDTQFSQASEACLSGLEITRQIQNRLQILMAVESKALTDFLGDELIPYYTVAVQCAKQEGGRLFDTELTRTLQILSPSDFGFHNALVEEGSDRLVFMDFEYFGWDDPVKLISDFYWHPGMNLTSHLREQWLKSALKIFQDDPSFARRLSAYLPLLGIRWCLILLNEFHRQGAENRLHADPQKASDLAKIRVEQLNKSKILLEQIKETTSEYG